MTHNAEQKDKKEELMANGEEDLREKNRDKTKPSPHYSEWSSFQGREDAEMLQEKSNSWKSKKDFFREHDRYDNDY